MHFLLKNSFFREVHFCRKPHASFAQFFFCHDRGRQYLSRRICEIFTLNAYIVNDITVNIKVGLSLCVSNMQVHAPTYMS